MVAKLQKVSPSLAGYDEHWLCGDDVKSAKRYFKYSDLGLQGAKYYNVSLRFV